jgi:thiosulfate reductase cytochrome b subunit
MSRTWSHVLPRRHAVRDALHVVLHDMHVRRHAPDTTGYNAAQRITYTAVLLMGLGEIVSGLAIYKSAQFGLLTFLLGGYRAARAIHFAIAVGFVLFFVVHIAQVARAGWQNLRAMIVGFAVVRAQSTSLEDDPESGS